MALAWLLILLHMVVGESRKQIQLIAPINGTNNFMLTKEGRVFFNSLGDSLISIQLFMGSYRSGKSFLLNRVLNVSHADGFTVGGTYRPETKGIWVWGEANEAVIDQKKVRVVYLDTEGINAPQAGEVYDAKLSLMSVFLASNVYFNILGTMESSSLLPLTEAMRLGALFKASLSEWTLPTLFWINQSPRLVANVPEGELIDFLVYSSIRNIKNKGPTSHLENLELFPCPDPKILLIPHPNKTWEDSDLDKLPEENYSKDYLKGVQNLRDIILTRAKIKSFSGEYTTAKEFYKDLEEFMNWLRSYNDMADTVIRASIRELVIKCSRLYLNTMNPAASYPPLGKASFIKLHEDSEKIAITTYENEGKKMSNETAFEEGKIRLKEQIENEYQNFGERRDYLSKHYCMDAVDIIWKKYKKDTYEDIDIFDSDVKTAKDEFFNDPRCSDIIEQVWEKKMETVKDLRYQIVGVQQKGLLTNFSAILFFLALKNIFDFRFPGFFIRCLIIAWACIIFIHNYNPNNNLPQHCQQIAFLSNRFLAPLLQMLWNTFFKQILVIFFKK
uniref:GB1/RHD3-type G domain-containing protein n=1 Tax=Arcella intermedia TaxID=1963864 RepID=A0A6B2L0Z1_9EUKA